jgi:sialate O-acetylesterase
MHRFVTSLCTLLTVLLLVSATHAQELKLAQVFADHMVLQHGMKAPVWGWAPAGSDVTVKFMGQALTAKADANGKWQTAFAPLAISAEPKEMTVTSGDKTVTVADILVGDVWLCSGQSNMEFTVSRTDQAEQDIKDANFPMIRHFKVGKDPQMFPLEQFKSAEWTVCSPETVGGYTAAGYFFGMNLHKALNIPIGLLHSSWGGTRIEPWTPRIGFKNVKETSDIYEDVLVKDPTSPEYKALAEKYLSSVTAWAAAAKNDVAAQKTISDIPAFPNQIKPYTSHQSPTMLYNGMLAPMVPFAIKGSIWYQGESNHGEGMKYVAKTQALVEGWREVWGIKDLPYYFVQIAPYQYGSETGTVLAKFWEAQAAIETTIPNTGMVVISDIGNLKDIHPKNKRDVGLRLANMALVKTYGKTGIVYHGPVYKSMKTDGDKLVLTFDHVGSGLASRDGKPLDNFEIGGPKKTWTPAIATITGNDTLELTAEGVEAPCVVRFAYDKLATPNLMNKEGLPAQTFMAGEMPDWDSMSVNAEESTKYSLVYDMDLGKLGKTANYTTDNSGAIGKFSRVAYYLELTDAKGESNWVYVSMDAFTDDAKKIGLPVYGAGIEFQQAVKNLNVLTSVKGLSTGNNLDGNIEFWPNNYAGQNGAKVPGADNNKYDIGDKMSDPQDGYGCMQVHLTKQKQTVFAINSWKSGGNGADIGIGNRPEQNTDWTFARNGASYTAKRLRVLVLPAP